MFDLHLISRVSVACAIDPRASSPAGNDSIFQCVQVYHNFIVDSVEYIWIILFAAHAYYLMVHGVGGDLHDRLNKVIKGDVWKYCTVFRGSLSEKRIKIEI